MRDGDTLEYFLTLLVFLVFIFYGSARPDWHYVLNLYVRSSVTELVNTVFLKQTNQL